MDHRMVLEYLQKMNPDEITYRDYYYARKENRLDSYLKTLSIDDLKKRKILIPELVPGNTTSNMLDEEYFDSASKNSVFLSKHNRYTPRFEHTHVFFEIIYVLKGQASHYVLGEKMTLHQGDLCLVSPSIYHSIFVNDDDSIIINILIRRKTIEDIFHNVLRDNSIISTFLLNSLYLKKHESYLLFQTAGDREVEDSILEMYMEQMEEDAYSDRIISSMLIIFFTKLVRKYRRTVIYPNSIKDAEKTSGIFRYITDEIETITLSDLADRLNYTVPYCSKMIKEQTGYTFNQLVHRLRFEQAQNWLTSTNMNIQDMSERLGYENPESFMRAFKKRYGCTPSEYRQSNSRL